MIRVDIQRADKSTFKTTTQFDDQSADAWVAAEQAKPTWDATFTVVKVDLSQKVRLAHASLKVLKGKQNKNAKDLEDMISLITEILGVE